MMAPRNIAPIGYSGGSAPRSGPSGTLGADNRLTTYANTTRRRVDTILELFFADKARRADSDRLPPDIVGALHAHIFAGGSRTRATLCALGWQSNGGQERLPGAVLRAAASLELHHAGVVAYNDLIENQEPRRGIVPLRRMMEFRYVSESLGKQSAGLLGLLTLAWSDELFHGARLTARQRCAAIPVLAEMRADVIYGQLLALTGMDCDLGDVDLALRIVRYKTVGYRYEHPLQLGASLAGANPDIRRTLSAYARPLGEASQLCADLRSVFGNPLTREQPRPEDLQRSRTTVLFNIAAAVADADQRAELLTLTANPDLDATGAQRCREIIETTGAAAETVRMVAQRRALALQALEATPIPMPAAEMLRVLARRVTANIPSSCCLGRGTS
ncbi:polyprenyl synthetase family protein [Nocardia panacis]|uniref:Polyprenyl synthetase family protein n=1 Tax=Nocardia panacis TaxID=2340916 RepID=A0A3A4KM80_9NOCA|nr:polyprenyl synthetase family protein [Nocardia panacis]RJO70636.1 polyprenyl synthetase family protein [Nocardia panacis]